MCLSDKQTAHMQATNAAEAQILNALANSRGRGKDGVNENQQAAIAQAVKVLEAQGGVQRPTAKPELLDGR
jgi:hypothetical protein